VISALCIDSGRITGKQENEGQRNFRLPTPLLLAFVDFLCEFAKLLGLFVACLYL
jgi:hypothetical protein